MTARRPRGGKGDEARVRVAFRVPMPFAFAWCTDFSPDDAVLEGGSYEPKILERTPRRAVFEDLEETEAGWIWSRDVVMLRPPNRWHMEGIGNRRDVTAGYRLSRLPGGWTQLDLRWWRRAKPPGKRIPRRRREREAALAWKRFGLARKREYRRSLPARRRRRG